jgi:hypothetical protein
MNLQDRLKALIGHDVMMNTLRDSGPQDTPEGVPPGRLREVGDDYVIVQTTTREEDGGSDSEWIVSTKHVISVIHMVPGCAGCAVDAASGKLKS